VNKEILRSDSKCVLTSSVEQTTSSVEQTTSSVEQTTSSVEQTTSSVEQTTSSAHIFSKGVDWKIFEEKSFIF
jgi:methyl-accepting chemotaxis protein